jgi:hypothetical protein
MFAAKAGSLEGYVYQRDDETSLDDWVNNITGMYEALPANIKEEINDTFKGVLERTLSRAGKSLSVRNRELLTRMLGSLTA